MQSQRPEYDPNTEKCAQCHEPLDSRKRYAVLKCIHKGMHVDCNPTKDCHRPIRVEEDQCPLCLCIICHKQITRDLFKKKCGCRMHENCRPPIPEIFCVGCNRRVEEILPARRSPPTFVSSVAASLTGNFRPTFTSDYVGHKSIETLISEGMTANDVMNSDCPLSRFVANGLRWHDFINIGLMASNVQRKNCFDVRILVEEWEIDGHRFLQDLNLSAGRFLRKLAPSLTELETLKVTLRVLILNGLQKDEFLRLPWTPNEMLTCLKATADDFRLFGFDSNDCLALIREHGWTITDFSRLPNYSQCASLAASVEGAIKRSKEPAPPPQRSAMQNAISAITSPFSYWSASSSSSNSPSSSTAPRTGKAASHAPKPSVTQKLPLSIRPPPQVHSLSGKPNPGLLAALANSVAMSDRGTDLPRHSSTFRK